MRVQEGSADWEKTRYLSVGVRADDENGGKSGGMEKELETVEGRLNDLDRKLGNMGGKMENVNGQLESVESGMESVKEYLREVSELLVTRDGGATDKGKAPMEPHPSPSLSSSVREVTPPPPVNNTETNQEKRHKEMWLAITLPKPTRPYSRNAVNEGGSLGLGLTPKNGSSSLK